MSTTDDEFAKPEQDFQDAIKALHGVQPKTASSVAATVVADVKAGLVDTAEALKPEFTELEARFKAAVDALDDKVTRGVANPVFGEAKKLVSHIAAMAKAL